MTVRAALLFCLLIAPAATLRAAGNDDSSYSALAAWPGDEMIAEAGPGDAAPDAAAAGEPKQETPASVLTPPRDFEAQLSLKEAVLLALRNNLDVELARTEPMIAEEGVTAARGAYDPVLMGNFNFDRRESSTVNRLQLTNASVNSQNLNSSDGWTYGAGFNGILPFGLQYSSMTGLNRLDTNAQVVPLDKQFESTWISRLTLPLRRDLGWNLASVTVRRSEIARDMTQEQFRGSLNGIVASVEDLYWNLAANRAAVRVAAKSLKTAQDLLEQTRVQQEVGVVSRVAVTQAEAGVAEREVLFIQTENLAATAKDALLDALLAPSAQAFEDRDLIPEAPRFEDYQTDIDASLRKALRSRPELAQARKAVEMAGVEADFADNQARSRFDLVASYGTQGLSGSGKMLPTPDTSTMDPNDFILVPFPDQGRSTDSFQDFFRGTGAKSYSAGVRVEMPLGNNTGEARAVQRRIETRRAQIALKKQEQRVILEVRNAVRGVRAATQQVSASERRVAATVETLRAEQERLRLGDSTPFQVLQFDEDLAEAEQSRIVALRQQANAITALERVQGTLLETRGIRFEDELTQ
jgi:HAE1 family hydrophobic/amphiphilic exporter-1